MDCPHFAKSLGDIAEQDVQGLIDDEVAEDQTIEYKAKLQLTRIEDKAELCRDISAFANASGGCIVYGLGEKRDQSNKTTGKPDKIVPILDQPDALINRLSQILHRGVQPNIRGLDFRGISISSGGHVIVGHIPKSLMSPHIVACHDDWRFYARGSNGRYRIDVPGLRSAFVESESLWRRVERFRVDRIAKIVADDTPFTLGEWARVIIHLLPISGFAQGPQEDITTAVAKMRHELKPIRGDSEYHIYNLDGFAVCDMDVPRAIC